MGVDGREGEHRRDPLIILDMGCCCQKGKKNLYEKREKLTKL